MFKENFEPLVVKMAYETIEMHEELVDLRAQVIELKEYRKRYFDLLDSSIKHSEKMMSKLVISLLDNPKILQQDEVLED